jgi:hypothetical protein
MSDWGHTRWLEPSSHRGFSSFGQIGHCPRRLRPKICRPLVPSVYVATPRPPFKWRGLRRTVGTFGPCSGPRDRMTIGQKVPHRLVFGRSSDV